MKSLRTIVTITLIGTVACGGGNGHEADASQRPDASRQSDAPPDVDAAPDVDARPLTYSLSTIAGHCDTLVAPETMEIISLLHTTEVRDLPFAFPFFDAIRTRFAVVEQGQLLLFDDNTANITTLVSPEAIPSTEAPDGFIAPLWTFKLSAMVNVSLVRYAETGAGADARLVVEWNDFKIGALLPDSTSHLTLQAKLFRDGAIELHYCELDPGATSTGDETGTRASIGIESPEGRAGVSAAFETPGAASTLTAYRFAPDPE